MSQPADLGGHIFRVNFHADTSAFGQLTQPFLLEREAENSMMLGLTPRLEQGSHKAYWMATVEVDGVLVGCALQTPPYAMFLTRMPEGALETLADAVLEHRPRLEGVHGAVEIAERFSSLWRARTSAAATIKMSLGLYSLSQVCFPERTVPGAMRLIHEDDADFLPTWLEAFVEETGLPAHVDGLTMFERRLKGRSLFLWETEGRVVAMAGTAGRTPNGIRVNAVYTPPELRGRGSATALVAQLSQQQLDEGRSLCFLYTDLRNPISNRLYRKLGYRHLGDAQEIGFRYQD